MRFVATANRHHRAGARLSHPAKQKKMKCQQQSAGLVVAYEMGAINVRSKIREGVMGMSIKISKESALAFVA